MLVLMQHNWITVNILSYLLHLLPQTPPHEQAPGSKQMLQVAVGAAQCDACSNIAAGIQTTNWRDILTGLVCGIQTLRGIQERKIINKSALHNFTTKGVSVLTNYTLKKYGKVEIKVNIFLLWATVGGEWLTLCSSKLPLRNCTQHPIDKSQGQSDTHVHVCTHTLLNIQYYSNTSTNLRKYQKSSKSQKISAFLTVYLPLYCGPSNQTVLWLYVGTHVDH
jgi:hypothetical protein